ncbi:unnamed protein product [Rotaria socialis]|uniref:Dynein regulatory complex protein 12 n=1 Tax=Rotaria socialis TaxID=392032 RepID=A0A820L2B2_9BILA|nr:unnamed protein product [Rotaria socialis]CAF3404114.1 unnamed protein product [Rotaria socialis]CAF3450063.1 unnamed protein product [Rotaria socialis]CAF3451710.1 unnamed protein product [Rotaria socialis]CAF3455884.1 unnamed protein product [Rotaria socialis]
MPPKKKGKGKKKKGGDDNEMEVKFKQSQHEVDALKDQMAYRRELSRRSLATADNYREQMQTAQANIEELQSDMKAVSSGLTQQYKTMQMELGFKITQIEMELSATKSRLSITDQDLAQQRVQYEKMQREKDAHIQMLDGKISNLETSFENLIDIGFNNILTRLNEEKQKWDIKMDTIFDENKRSLRNLNLIHLEV